MKGYGRASRLNAWAIFLAPFLAHSISAKLYANVGELRSDSGRSQACNVIAPWLLAATADEAKLMRLSVRKKARFPSERQHRSNASKRHFATALIWLPWPTGGPPPRTGTTGGPTPRHPSLGPKASAAAGGAGGSIENPHCRPGLHQNQQVPMSMLILAAVGAARPRRMRLRRN